MPESITRRSLIGSATTASAAMLAMGRLDKPARAATVANPLDIHKAVKYQMIDEDLSVTDKFKLLKDLGYDGVELPAPLEIPMKEVIAARDASGINVHGMTYGRAWRIAFNDPDKSVRDEAINGLKQALRDTKEFGGTAVLVVPAVVKKEWSYADAYKHSLAGLRACVETAEETGIAIAIENVWNNFLLSPVEAARFVDACESPMVRWYFDVGNIVRMGWPEHWIEALGKRTIKLDIKEYSREKQINEGLRKGFNVELLEGDCDWPSVMAALAKTHFTGWATAEVPGGDRTRLKDIAERMDRIFALAPK